jgi:hypothetical protein
MQNARKKMNAGYGMPDAVIASKAEQGAKRKPKNKM